MFIKKYRSTVRAVLCAVIGFSILFPSPFHHAYAAEKVNPAQSSGASVQTEKESDFFEGALKLEGTAFVLPEASSSKSASAGQKTSSGTLKSANNGVPSYSLYELGGNEYGYNSLEDSEKRLFDAVGDTVEAFIASDLYKEDLTAETAALNTVFEFYYENELSNDDVAKTICRFVYSNPQYYWIGLSYSYAVDAEKAAAVITVDPYYYSYESRKKVDDAVKAKLDSWVDEVCSAASLGDFYAALKAHDIIIRAIDYAYDASGKPEQSAWAHSVAGVFTGQGAVCEGYAKCFEYLLNKAGIPNIYILGTGANDAHAWNAVSIYGQWYLCDITWDDPDSSAVEGLKDSNYTYFCMPESKFNLRHRAWDDANYYGYELPEFENTMEQTYFTVFDCYSDEAFSEASGESFAYTITENRYRDNDYIFAAFPERVKNSFVEYVVPHLPGTGEEKDYTLTETAIGIVAKYAAPIIERPADSISIEKELYQVDISGSVTVNAILPAGSDDRIVWSVSSADKEDSSDAERYVKISAEGCSAVITGRRNGTVILTAALYSSIGTEQPITASCMIKVGSGANVAEAVIWQNGTKKTKTVTIKPELHASGWKDAKGNAKTGKLVWFVSDESIVPEFDMTKHKVSFSSAKSKLASVNTKGVVTAKKAGTVFVYVCDTGSMTFEEHIIEIAAGPTKFFITSIANTTNKDMVLKKVTMDAGTMGKAYITPFIKDGAVDKDCTYSVKISKSEMAKYLSVDTVVADEDGNAYFTFTALDFNQAKEKTVSVKLEVICDQTGKKASMTVVIGNPVLDATCREPDDYDITTEDTTGTTDTSDTSDVSGTDATGSSETNGDTAGTDGGSGATDTSGNTGSSGGTVDPSLPTLSKKNDKVTFKLYLYTALGNTNITTDKIKIYVGLTDVSFNENDKVEAEKGATVKAKFDRKTMQLTLTASKDAGNPAIITAAFTDVLTKEITLIDLIEVDEDGVITVW